MSEETYRAMCSTEPMRRILAGLWKPKAGDRVWRKFDLFGKELDERIWPDKSQREEIIILREQSSIVDWWHCTNEEGESRLYNGEHEVVKATCIWLPSSDDLMEMLKTQGVFMLEIVWDKHEFSVILDKAEPEDYLWGDTAKEALLRAFGHTQGLKWEDGKWKSK